MLSQDNHSTVEKGTSAPPSTEILKLDIKGIHEYQQNRFPFLFIDAAHEVIPGVSAKGYKNLSINEWFFDVHFPGDPTMPGMLQIEAMVQLGALMVLTLPGNKGKVAYITNANKLKFRRKILPGDRFDLSTTLHSWKRGIGQCSGKGMVNGEIACEAEFTIVMPDVLTEFRVSL